MCVCVCVCVCVSNPSFRTDEVCSDPDPHQTPSVQSGLKLKPNTSILQQNTGRERQHKPIRDPDHKTSHKGQFFTIEIYTSYEN